VNDGVEVVALSLDFPEPLPGVGRQVAADAADPDAVADAVAGCDAVVHLAAIIHRDHAAPLEVYRTNVSSTFNVLSQAGMAGVRRAVIASSINAYGVPLHHLELRPDYFPLDEDLPVHIDDWYSLSKISDELTLGMACSHWDMSGVALRFPWVNSAETIRRESAVQTEAPVHGLTVGWAYLETHDAARAVRCALRAELAGSNVVGVAAEDTLLPYPTAELLAAFAPDVPLRRAVPGRGALVDTSRSRELLGFRPEFALELPERSLVVEDGRLPA
jgi:nucleoside-diphosphate-sugar epimerase